MNSLWHSTRASLDDSLAVVRGSLGKLRAAKSVDVAEIIEQFEKTSESACVMRELVWSELPEASWQNRQELDALVNQIQENLAARAIVQQRVRLLALANELECGTVVHRRAHRLQELNQLREQAITELRFQAGLEAAPPPLPGPEADQWIGWACGLQEPEDTEFLRDLRNGYAHLDDFVANLEPKMWRGTSPIPQVPPEPVRPAEKTQPERSREGTGGFEGTVASSGPTPIDLPLTEPSNGRGDPRRSGVVEELPRPALHSNTLTPHDVTPPPTVKHAQKKHGSDDALLAGMMGLVSDPVGHYDTPVELPFTGQAFREASAASTSVATEPVEDLDQSVEPPSPGEVHGNASAAAAGVSDPVISFSGRGERHVTGEVFRETIVAPPGLVSGSVDDYDQPVERSFNAKLLRAMSAASEIFPRLRFGFEERWSRQRGMLLAIAAVLVVAVLGAILWISGATLWKSGGNRANPSPAPVSASETKTADLTPSNPSNPEGKQSGQPGMSDGSASRTSETKAHVPEVAKEQLKEQSKEHSKEQAKPQEQNAASKPPAKAVPAKQTSGHDEEVLRPPTAVPSNVVAVKKEEAPPNVAAEMPAAIPGGMPNGVPSSVANIVKNAPVAVPKINPEKVRISSGVAQGLLIHQIMPQYPSQARQAHIQGTVVLQAVIGKDGAVQSLHVLSGHPMLNQAAMDAVKKWRYKPYRLDGEPVEADTQINVNFTLSGE